MLARLTLVLSIVALTSVVSPHASADPAGPHFEETIALSGLEAPTVARFARDGRIFVAEKSGIIKVFDSLSDPTPEVFADLRTNVNDFWDRGLLGMALDPAFPDVPFVYVLYTYDAAIGDDAPRWGIPGEARDECGGGAIPFRVGCLVSGRLSRLTAAGNAMTGVERVLINDWCQQFPSHSVGSLAFGPDGMLYAGGGEGANFDVADYGQLGDPANPCGDPGGPHPSPPDAQGGALRSQDLRTADDPAALNGTIVRIDPSTGAAAPGNPLASSDDANTRRIVAYGLRNPFRMAIRPGASELWIGDVGWLEHEEIDRIVDPTDATVENFGWPCYEGFAAQPKFAESGLRLCADLYAAEEHAPGTVTAPVFTYDAQRRVTDGETCGTAASSISGMAFYDGGNYPAAYAGALFFADHARDCIWVMYPGVDGVPDPASVQTFAAPAAHPVDLEIGPGGDLFYVDLDDGTLNRISWAGDNRPPAAVARAELAGDPTGHNVAFSATASSDPDPGDSLSFAWDLDGDGSYDDSRLAEPGYEFTAPGTHTIGLRVIDDDGAYDTTSVTITTSVTGNPPVPVIDAPAAVNWQVGDVLAFAGHATDADGHPLHASALSWELVLRHCPSPDTCHEHLLAEWQGEAGGRFRAPDHGYPSYLELRLTARDEFDVTATASLRLDPRTVELSFETSPPGLPIRIGWSPVPSPLSRTAIVGSSMTIDVPAAGDYVFTGWSDGGAARHTIVAPSEPATWTATFVPGMHLGELRGIASSARWLWSATAEVTVHGPGDAPLAGVLVTGGWNIAPGRIVTCLTGADGRCRLRLPGIPSFIHAVTFTVGDLTRDSYAYDPARNHDPHGDGAGTTLVIARH